MGRSLPAPAFFNALESGPAPLWCRDSQAVRGTSPALARLAGWSDGAGEFLDELARWPGAGTVPVYVRWLAARLALSLEW
jgi:hypothetical protein